MERFPLHPHHTTSCRADEGSCTCENIGKDKSSEWVDTQQSTNTTKQLSILGLKGVNFNRLLMMQNNTIER